jgi:DNA-binding XRE family transcriptional regulator
MGLSGPHPPAHLKRCRLLAGYSQRALADRAGITRQALGALESGRTRPRLTTAVSIAQALGQDLAACFPELLEKA